MINKSTTWITTDIQVQQVIFQWSITNFSYLQTRPGEKITSPPFYGQNKLIEWKLQLYPFADCREDQNHVSVHLEFNSANVSEVATKYKLAIVNHLGHMTYLRNNEIRLEKGKSWGVKIISRNDLCVKHSTCLLPKDTLTLYAELEYVSGSKFHGGTLNESGSQCPKRIGLYPNLITLQQNGHFSDLTVVVGNTKFMVHRVILSAASPVFASMLKHDTQEKQTGYVQIDDLNSQTFATLISMIYGSEVPSFNKTQLTDVEELLRATDKYQISELKSLMEASISHLLSVDTASSILAIADRTNALILKSNAIKFIKSCKLNVMATKQWQDEMKLNPALFTELIMDIID